MATLSVVISAFNEEKKLGDCLESVKDIASEIIVIDNSSTDKTAAIAKKYTKHIFTRPNHEMLNINKNFGFTKATGEWILCLDADERVSKELAQEIESRIKNQESRVEGHWIPRKNIIFGKWIEHTGWYPDKQLRLFKRGSGKFAEKHVHEMIVVSGETLELSGDIIHYNYETVAQFLHKVFVIYGPNEAEQLLENGYTFNALDAIRMPAKEFISRFFAQQGYKDGLHGLVLSLLMACYHLVVFCYLWEKQKFVDSVDIKLSHVGKEFTNIQKEIAYWQANEAIKNSKSVAEKYWHKIRRKAKI
jgi:glycosyltransferase involved in cell wall biosynthesis